LYITSEGDNPLHKPQLTPYMMTTQELKSLSIEELRELNSKVINAINLKKKEMAMDIKFAINVGDVVKVDHPKLDGIDLVVEKIKRTKAILSIANVGNPERFNVPLSMIKA